VIDQDNIPTSVVSGEKRKIELTDRLRQLPFMELDDLITYASIETEDPVLSQIEVEKVVSAPNATNWTIEDSERVYGLSQLVKSGEINLDSMEPPKLFCVNGLYGVLHDGRHRVAAKKLIGLEQPEHNEIRAEVSQVKKFTKVFAFSQEEYDELLRRKEEGLWQGNIEGGPNNSVPTGFAALGTIENYVGPWVFSRNMEKAKLLYNSLVDYLQPTTKEIGYFRVTNRSFEEVDKALSITETVKKLKPNSKVLDVGSGIFQQTAAGIGELRPDITVISSDATLGLEPNDFRIFDTSEGEGWKETTYISKDTELVDEPEVLPDSYQEDRRKKAVNSVASLQPSLPFANESFDLIIDSWGPGMYLDRKSEQSDKSQMSVYLDNICRTLKHEGEFRMYPIDNYDDLFMTDEQRNEKALIFFRNYFKNKQNEFSFRIFSCADGKQSRLGLVLTKK